MGLVTDVLATMRNGAADRAASEILAKVVQAVEATGKKGSVTIKLDINMLKNGDGEKEVKATISHKMPSEDIPVGIYYSDEEGQLYRDNPRQITMELDSTVSNLSDRRFAGASGKDL